MTTLIRWDPFREMASLQNDMSRLMGGMAGAGNGGDQSRTWIPPLDVWETDDDIVYAFDLPGMSDRMTGAVHESRHVSQLGVLFTRQTAGICPVPVGAAGFEGRVNARRRAGPVPALSGTSESRRLSFVHAADRHRPRSRQAVSCLPVSCKAARTSRPISV